nr:MAG TPA: hypothetical protein [Bacteriophage sp.]
MASLSSMRCPPFVIFIINNCQLLFNPHFKQNCCQKLWIPELYPIIHRRGRKLCRNRGGKRGCDQNRQQKEKYRQ